MRLATPNSKKPRDWPHIYHAMMADRQDKRLELADKARKLPKTPGVYLMKDPKGRVIYVGKAARLRDRVGSYFTKSVDLGPGKQSLLTEVHDFDTIDCEGEWEALLTENRLIKDLHPKYNRRLTDDKTFPYLVVTMRDDYPGVFITREPAAPQFKGAKVLGPFTSVYALRESVQLLQRVFKFRTCHLDIRADDDQRRFFRPCLLYPIKQCTGPCGDKISKAAYREDIDRFVRFLGSKRSVMLRQMRQDMADASAAQDYERAAALRDQIRALQKLDERGKPTQNWQPETESFVADPAKGLESLRKTLALDDPIRCVECIDIAHLQGGETVGSKVCFVDGRPLKNEYRRYKIRTAENDDYAAIREVVSRRYRDAAQGHELYPDLIVIDGGVGQLNAAMQAFDDLAATPPAPPLATPPVSPPVTPPITPPMVVSLAKKEELIYRQGSPDPIRLPRNNPGLRLCQAIRDEAHRFAQHYHHILRRKKVIGE